MNRFRISLIATAAGLAGLTGVAAVAGPAAATAPAAGDPAVGKQVLDLLCTSKDGSLFYSPYAISRCQEARDNAGFQIEELVCEGLLDGTFVSAPSTGRPKRVNWSCIPGAIA
jgi:hypothetical protein